MDSKDMDSKTYVSMQMLLSRGRLQDGGTPVDETESAQTKRITKNTLDLLQEELRMYDIELKIDSKNNTFAVPMELRGYYIDDDDTPLLLGYIWRHQTKQDLYLLTLALHDYIIQRRKPHYLASYWRRLTYTLRTIVSVGVAAMASGAFIAPCNVVLQADSETDSNANFCMAVCALLDACEYYAVHGAPKTTISFSTRHDLRLWH